MKILISFLSALTMWLAAWLLGLEFERGFYLGWTFILSIVMYFITRYIFLWGGEDEF